MPSKNSHDHALQARTAKRAAAEAIGVDERYIAQFIARFYAAVREDECLGPIFRARISDWDAHLERMNRFWRSVLHNSGEFSGNPMLKHIAIPGLTQEHFDHWLTLFYATLRGMERDPAATDLVAGRARMIAESLLTGIEVDRDGIRGAGKRRVLPHV